MAITKIKAIKGTKAGGTAGAKRNLAKQIDYICNEYKTDGNILISTFGCIKETATHEFLMTDASVTQRKNSNLAYHLKQAFKPGEVSPEEAHQIGMEYAKAILGEKYQFVMATHIDREHIHNHLIFCATSYIDKEKYNDCTKERYFRERENDRICIAHGLSVIEEKSGKRGYRVWENENVNKEQTQREQIQDRIEYALKRADSYEKFLVLLQQSGVEVKDNGEEFSYKLFDKKRYLRADTFKIIDENTGDVIENPYCKRDVIMQIINNNSLENDKKYMTREVRKILIVEVEEKVEKQKSDYETYKSDLDKLTKMVRTVNYMHMNNIDTDTDLETQLKEKSALYEKAKSEYNEFKNTLDKMSMTINYGKIYWKYKKIFEKSQKLNLESDFVKENEKAIISFLKAKKYMELNGISEKELNIKGMIQEYQNRKSQLEPLAENLKIQKEEYQKILAVKSNCELITGRKITSMYDRIIEENNKNEKIRNYEEMKNKKNDEIV